MQNSQVSYGKVKDNEHLKPFLSEEKMRLENLAGYCNAAANKFYQELSRKNYTKNWAQAIQMFMAISNMLVH